LTVPYITVIPAKAGTHFDHRHRLCHRHPGEGRDPGT